MTRKTYEASCHCGAVRFEADFDISEGTTRCNCSICTKARSWFHPVPAADVRVLFGDDMLSEYHWTPPNRPQANLHYRFCKRCGIRAFAEGNQPELGGKFYAVAISTLDNANADELAASIKYVDGRNDRYDRQPDDIRLM